MVMKLRIKAFALVLISVLLTVGAAVGNSLTAWAGETDNSVIIPVLMYHNVAEEYPESGDGANVKPQVLREHLTKILEKGYQPIFVSDYYNCVERGGTLPENPIIITFDDGYLSNYELAFPILKEMNIPATIFVVTSTVGATAESGKVANPHFTWEQAREMQESGIVEIQSHSHTHRDMTSLSVAQLQEELRISRYLIETNLKESCYAFSYPFGRYNETTSRLARYAGYRMQILVNDAESGEDSLANNVEEGIEHFTRLTVYGSMTADDLIRLIDTAVENTRSLD